MEENSITSKEETWSNDIETILYNILDNIKILQKLHKDKYLKLKGYLMIFRLPLIILSSLNSVFSVGLSIFLSQSNTSVINCLLSLICAVISAVELFLQISKNMEVELSSYHQYKLLAIKISHTLKLDSRNREMEGSHFLNEVISEYKNIFENSLVNDSEIDGRLFKYEGKVTSPLSPRINYNDFTTYTVRNKIVYVTL